VHGDLRGVSAQQTVQFIVTDHLQANVLIAKDGSACLSDFGLSKFLEDVSAFHYKKIHRTGPKVSHSVEKG